MANMNWMGRRFGTTIICLLTMCWLAPCCSSPAPRKYLSCTQATTLTLTAISTGLIGIIATDFDSSRTSILKGSLPGESSLMRLLGGDHYPGKSNWLDRPPAALITSAACGLILLGSDLAWPENKGGKDAAQDLFLYTAGLITTQGISDLCKGFFARPRPYLNGELNPSGEYLGKGYPYDHCAFFSSHTSNAFFSAAFLNKHLRQLMIREMCLDTYRDWRWAPPTILFAWAAYVGWTRIQSYNHYPSDVIVGAMAGWLLAEFFYSIGDNGQNSFNSTSRKRIIFQVGFVF